MRARSGGPGWAGRRWERVLLRRRVTDPSPEHLGKESVLALAWVLPTQYAEE